LKAFRLFIVILLFAVPAFSNGSEIIGTARLYYEKSEYYNAITELMRYQFLLPEGPLFNESMLLMGEAYYKGGNSSRAVGIFTECYNRFPDSEPGEKALYYSGYVRLNEGSYFYAARIFQQYNYVFKGGDFYEDSVFSLCLIRLLAEDYTEAESGLALYREQFPGGRYYADSEYLTGALHEMYERPVKNTWVAGLSSAVCPGLGYFYTEKYMLGAFAMLSNAALIYLAYDGYRDGSMFRVAIFSFIELSFYNWAVVGSILSAREYNDKGKFGEEILLRIKRPF